MPLFLKFLMGFMFFFKVFIKLFEPLVLSIIFLISYVMVFLTMEMPLAKGLWERALATTFFLPFTYCIN